MEDQKMFPEEEQIKRSESEAGVSDEAAISDEMNVSEEATVSDKAQDAAAEQEIPAEKEAPAEQDTAAEAPDVELSFEKILDEYAQEGAALSDVEVAAETADSGEAETAPDEAAKRPPWKSLRKTAGKPWNKKLWIACGAAVVVLALLVAIIVSAATASPLTTVEKALNRTLSDLGGSEGLLERALNGGSIEASVSGTVVNELFLGASAGEDDTAGLKLYADLAKDSAALTLHAPVAGQAFDAALHVNGEAVALELPQMLDKSYGTAFKTFKDSLASSVFAPDSGSYYAIDEATYEQLLDLVNGNDAKSAKDANKRIEKAADQLAGVLLKNVKKYAEITETNETIAFMQTPVKTTRVRVQIDGAAMEQILRNTLTWVKEDKGFKSALTEFCQMYMQTIAAAGSVRATEPQDLVDRFYDAVYDGLDACDGIADAMDGERLELDFYMTKSGKRLVQMEVELTGAFECVLTLGPDPKTPELVRVRFDDGWDSVDVSYSVQKNDKREYASQFSFQQDGSELASASIDWNKKEGDLRVKLVDAELDETILIKGSLRRDKNAMELHIRSITVEEDIIKPDLTVIVTARDKMPAMPEFTDILTIDEEELTSIFAAYFQMAYGLGYDITAH